MFSINNEMSKKAFNNEIKALRISDKVLANVLYAKYSDGTVFYKEYADSDDAKNIKLNKVIEGFISYSNIHSDLFQNGVMSYKMDLNQIDDVIKTYENDNNIYDDDDDDDDDDYITDISFYTEDDIKRIIEEASKWDEMSALEVDKLIREEENKEEENKEEENKEEENKEEENKEEENTEYIQEITKDLYFCSIVFTFGCNVARIKTLYMNENTKKLSLNDYRTLYNKIKDYDYFSYKDLQEFNKKFNCIINKIKIQENIYINKLYKEMKIKSIRLSCFIYLVTSAIALFLQNFRKIPQNTKGFVIGYTVNILGIEFNTQVIDGKIIFIALGRFGFLVNNIYNVYDIMLNVYSCICHYYSYFTYGYTKLIKKLYENNEYIQNKKIHELVFKMYGTYQEKIEKGV